MIKRAFLELPAKLLPFLTCFLLLLSCHFVQEVQSLFPPQTLLDSIRPESIRAHVASPECDPYGVGLPVPDEE